MNTNEVVGGGSGAAPSKVDHERRNDHLSSLRKAYSLATTTCRPPHLPSAADRSREVQQLHHIVHVS